MLKSQGFGSLTNAHAEDLDVAAESVHCQEANYESPHSDRDPCHLFGFHVGARVAQRINVLGGALHEIYSLV